MESSITLREFLGTAGQLSLADRTLIAEQALTILEGNYAHLPLKTARYAINPVQRLRLLLARLHGSREDEPEWRFHAELLDIFNSLHDLHTRYTLPEPFSAAGVHLSLQVKEYVQDGKRHFIVPPRSDGTPGGLPSGSELISWNGVPIERAVDVFGDRQPGANPAARRARALLLFTVRSLGFAGPPDEEFVLIQYRDPDGVLRETREVWQVELPAPGDTPEATEQATEQATERGTDLELDLEAHRVAWLRTALFAPQVLELTNGTAARVAVSGGIDVDRGLAKFLEARIIPGAGVADVGHIRIRSFTAPESTPFLNEFFRLLRLMPPGGVIIDIRGNGGGNPVAAELCLQALTARPIVSQPLQFISSPLNLRICRNSPAPDTEDLRAYLPSMEQAVESGAVYSAGVPRTSEQRLAQVPQSYVGPVLLLIDARVYSAADRFAAGFQDNRIGTVLGVDSATGAGGANVWQHQDLIEALTGDDGSPYRPLPAKTGISVAMRRTLRVGANTGAQVEDFGTVPDELHTTTREDVLNQSADLMAHAAALLLKQPARRFTVELATAADGITVRIDALRVDRADCSADGRPRVSVDVTDGAVAVARLGGFTPAEVRVVGFAAGEPVAQRIFRRTDDGRLTLVTSVE
jgi:hypothetical protein